MATLAQIKTVSERIGQHLKNISVLNQGRHRVSAALLQVADGHFQAIIFLFEQKFHASAFALLRPLMEASLRGAWALHCNDEKAVDEALQNDKFPMMSDAIERLEQLDGFSCGTLSRLFSLCKKALHSYTHGGSFQVVSHLTPESIEPSFSPQLIEEAMSIAAFFGLFAAANIALVANNAALAEKIGGEFDVCRGESISIGGLLQTRSQI
jgi:hypothetical protein